MTPNINSTGNKKPTLSTVASFFQELTTDNIEVRESAIITLISNLVNFQTEFQKQLDTEVWKNNLKKVGSFDDLAFILHTDVVYALKRLITGLNSSRDDARQGFALTLTELMRVLPFIPFKGIMDGVLKLSITTQSMKSEETRNNLFGRLFSLMALHQSEFLSQPHITADDWQVVLKTLLDLTHHKIFMSDSVYSLLYQMIKTLNDLSYGSQALETLWTLNLETGLEYPDELGLALCIYNSIPDRIKAIKEDVPVIRVDRWNDLASILSKQKPFQKSGLHFCWKLILDSFFNDSPLSKFFKSHFSQFWNAVIDGHLFVSSLNERKFIGFQALNYIVPKLSSEQLSIVFTDSTLKKIIHHLNRSKDPLHKIATITAEKIAEACQKDQSASISLLIRLHAFGGVKSSASNEKISQSAITKLTNPLMSSLNEEGLLNYINYLNSTFIGKETVPGRDIASGREWSIQQLFLIQKWSKLLHSELIYNQILEFFLIHAFFNIQKSNSKSKLIPLKNVPKPELSESVHKLCKDKLLATLKDAIKLAPLTKDKSPSVTSTKRRGTRVDGKLWIQYAVDLLDQFKKDKNLTLIQSLPDEVETIQKSILAKVKEIEKKKEKLKDQNSKNYHPLQAFLTLFLHQILYLHIQPEETLNSAKDIEVCYTKIFAPAKPKAKGKKSKAKAKEEEEEEEEDLEPIDVLVDLLISFLSQPSTLLRELATVTFSELTDLVTKSTLELLLEVLEIGAKSEGLNEDEEEMAEFPEIVHNDDEMSVDEDEDDDEEEEEEDDDDDDDSDIEEIDASGGIQIDLNKIKELEAAYQESDEERDYDDEEMMAFDEKIAAIFRERKKGLTEKREVKESISILKMKVLDLFSIYITKQPNNPNLIHLIIPLLSFIKRFQGSSGHLTAVDKATKIVSKELTKLELKDVDLEVLESILVEIDQLARRAPGHQQKLYLPVALFASRHLEADALDKVLGVYTPTLKWSFTNKKSTIKPQWFTELFQQSITLGWSLGETLLAFLDPKTALNSFRLTKALECFTNLIAVSAKKKHNPKNAKTFVNSIFIALEDMFKYAVSHPEDKMVKMDQAKEALRLATKLKQYCKAANFDSDYQPWMSEELKQNLIKFCALNDSHSSIISFYKQLTGNKLEIAKSEAKTTTKRALKGDKQKKTKKQKTKN